MKLTTDCAIIQQAHVQDKQYIDGKSRMSYPFELSDIGLSWLIIWHAKIETPRSQFRSRFIFVGK